MILTTEELNALRLSAVFSLAAATASMPGAIALAYWLARSKASWKWLIESIANLPLVLPPVVTGYLLLLLLAPIGPIGKLLGMFGYKIVFTPLAAIIAALVMSFPLAVRAIRLAFEGVNTDLEKTARTLGATRWETFCEISLPLAWRGLVGGWTMAFARSLGEFGATIMLAGNIAGKTQTIPLAIFSRATNPGGLENCWRLVLLSIIVSCVAVAIGERLVRKESR